MIGVLPRSEGIPSSHVASRTEHDSKSGEGRTTRDEALITAAQAGSSAAFVQLYNLYSASLLKAAWRITGNREDAEDVLQDSFMRAYQSLHSFQRRSSFSTWIRRIVINSALMLLRKRRLKREAPLLHITDAGEEIPVVEVRDEMPDPERRCMHRQRLAVVRRDMRDMAPCLREAVEMRMAHECTTREAAHLLGITDVAFKTRLFRARQFLYRREFA